MEHSKVKNLLNNRLRDNVGLFSVPSLNLVFTDKDVAWENVVFQAKDRSTPYLQPLYLPNKGRMATLGPSGIDYEQGLFQINIRVPQGQGNKLIWDYADIITKLYGRGTRIPHESGDFFVTVQNVFAAQALTDAGWHYAPVTVDWYVHLCRTS